MKESSENEEENAVMDIDSDGRILERLLQRQRELERQRNHFEDYKTCKLNLTISRRNSGN